MSKLIKPSFWLIFTLFFSLFSISQAAHAKRLGGGSSYGYSKSVPDKSFNTAPKSTPAAPAKPAAAGAATAAAKPASGASRWLGPLAGLAAGGLLAAMIFGDGFEGMQIMDILMFVLLGVAVFMIIRRLRANRAQSAEQPAYAHSAPSSPSYSHNERAESAQEVPVVHSRQAAEHTPYDPNQSGSMIGSALGEGLSEQATHLSADAAPAWFDAPSFAEGAKSHFVTLQAAWDAVDLAEVESYCTPELFAALQAEMQGMQPGDNVTVIDTLYADIADMAMDGEYFMVSIRFTGFIQEDALVGAHAFNEIWHIRRLANNEGNWQVAGIQQTH